MKKKFFNFSKKEIKDLLKAWTALSIAFAIAMNGFSLNMVFLVAVGMSALTVGLGFLFHEISHKLLAQRYGCIAEFRSNDTWLVLALMMSFMGFIFAAPGGVFIQGNVGRIRNGRISAVGIAANIGLAIVFLLLFFTTPLKTLSYYGLFINALLALFNLIPVANFDGRKVMRWNKKIYALMVVASISLMVAQLILNV